MTSREQFEKWLRAVDTAIDIWFRKKYPYPNKVSSRSDWLKHKNGMADRRALKKVILEKIYE